MFLLHHHLDGIDRYQTDGTHLLQKKRYFGSLEEVLRENSRSIDTWTILLLETDFVVRKFSVEITCDKPFNISQYKELLDEKKQLMIQETNGEVALLSYNLLGPGQTQGNEALQCLLGKTGLLTRSRCCRLPKPHIVLVLTEVLGYLSKWHQYISLQPRNYQLTQLIANQTGRTDFLLCQLAEHQAELCVIKEKWYTEVEYAPLGSNILVSTAEEQQVEKYLFGEFDQIARNSITKKLLTETIEFYIIQLIKRLQPSLQGQLIILCSSFVQHPLFLELFQQQLAGASTAFLLPLSPHSLPNISYTRQPRELPAWAWRKMYQ